MPGFPDCRENPDSLRIAKWAIPLGCVWQIHIWGRAVPLLHLKTHPSIIGFSTIMGC